MADLKNIAGCLLIDARAAFLNGAGLDKSGEDKNRVLPKTFWEKTKNGNREEVPYVSAQAWRRWLRNTVNEENEWPESTLQQIGTSKKGSTTKISTFLNPIDYPEDDLFGYMRSAKKEKKDGAGEDDGEEGEKVKSEKSVQRTSPFKSSILKGIPGKRSIAIDEAFVHLKEGDPLPYSTKFYSTHLEGFFNLEYYRLGVYDNLGSKVELEESLLKSRASELDSERFFKDYLRYSLKNAETVRKSRAAGLLRGLAMLRGGAKQAAFGADVSPKALVLAGLETANPVFNDLFEGSGEKPRLKIETLQEIAADYRDKLAGKIYIGIRAGYLENEADIKALDSEIFVVDTPPGIVLKFMAAHLKSDM